MRSDAGMKAAMLTAIVLVAVLGAVLGYAAAWLLARLLPTSAAIPLKIVTTLVGAVLAVHVVFPDILRSIVHEAQAPTYHFSVPAGFTGRFNLVLDPAGVPLPEHGGIVEIPVPPDRLLYVQPSPALEHTDPRLAATQGGAPVMLVPDESGTQQPGDIRFRSYYVGTWEQRNADKTPRRMH